MVEQLGRSGRANWWLSCNTCITGKMEQFAFRFFPKVTPLFSRNESDHVSFGETHGENDKLSVRCKDQGRLLV